MYNASSHPNAESTLKGNTHIQQLFAQRLAMGGENVTYIPFDGRSDYEAFLQAGIPAGGITTGAEVIKTMHMRDMFGGACSATRRLRLPALRAHVPSHPVSAQAWPTPRTTRATT